LARVARAGSLRFFGGDFAIACRIWGESCGEERASGRAALAVALTRKNAQNGGLYKTTRRGSQRP
jgi:hypothetical protein